eukprot:6921412-Karenia_brevis.AAC.1
MANLFKGKGSSMDCDASRGLLIADHASKPMAGIIQDRVMPSYKNFVGENQFGATPGLGTALANHVVRTFMDVCRLRG